MVSSISPRNWTPVNPATDYQSVRFEPGHFSCLIRLSLRLIVIRYDLSDLPLKLINRLSCLILQETRYIGRWLQTRRVVLYHDMEVKLTLEFPVLYWPD